MRFLVLLPILAAFAFLEIFIGGARLLYAIPGIAMVGLSAIFTLNPSMKTSLRANSVALLSSLLFAGYILIRNRFSEVEYIARLQFLIMAGCLLVYLIFTLVLARPADRRNLFLFLAILALMQMIPALIQSVNQDKWMPLPWAQRQDHDNWRSSGFFISPNNFSGFLEVMALFATSYAIWGRTTIMGRILASYTALSCVAGVALSGSRGGYLSLFFAFPVLMILSLIVWRRGERKRFLLTSTIIGGAALLCIGTLLFLVFMTPHLGERLLQINDPANPRLILWPSAIKQFHLSPIWGTGGFSFLYYGRLFRDPSVQLDPIHVHNDYLQLLADYGLVGASLFMIFLTAHLRAGGSAFLKLSSSSSHYFDARSDRLALNIGAISAVAAYMVHSVVDFNMQIPQNALMMAAVFAILANPGAPNEESREEEQGKAFRKFLRVSLPFFSLGLLIYVIPMIRGEYFAERTRLFLRNGDFQPALEWARKGTIKTRNNPELYFYHGEAAIRLAMQAPGKYATDPASLKSEAVSSFDSGLKLFPYDSRLALKLAEAKAAAGDYFSALDFVDYAQQLDPNSAFVPAYRGIVQYTFGSWDQARESFLQSIALGGQGAMIAQSELDQLNRKQNAIEHVLGDISTEPNTTNSPTEPNSLLAPDDTGLGTGMQHPSPTSTPQAGSLP